MSSTGISIILYLLMGVGAVLLILINHYFHFYRNRKTATFRRKVLDMVSQVALHRIMQMRDDWEEPYNLMGKHSYDSMVYSFKPLTLEAWFTAEEIEILKEEAGMEEINGIIIDGKVYEAVLGECRNCDL